MSRRLWICCGAAVLTASLIGAAKPPRAVYQSDKPAAAVVACLADRIREWDTPHVSPSTLGRTRIVTKIMHATRIDLAVSSSPTTVEVHGKSSKKLRSVIGDCV